MRIELDSIDRRIKEAGDEYVEGDISSEELEERLERVFRLEYTYAEVVCDPDALRLHDGRGMSIYGKEVEPGETVVLDDIFDVNPLDADTCPY